MIDKHSDNWSKLPFYYEYGLEDILFIQDKLGSELFE